MTGDFVALIEAQLASTSGIEDLRTEESLEAVERGLEPDHRSAVYFLWYGHRRLKRRKDLETCWKAIRVIAAGDGNLTEAERLMIVGKMCATGVPPAIVESVMTWDERDEHPADLLASVAFTEDARKEMGAWILYEGISASFADGQFSLDELERLRSLATTLGVARKTADTLIELCCEEAFLRSRRIAALREDVSIVVRSMVDPETK